MFGRRKARQVSTPGQMMRQELGDSIGHLREAATYGADGARVLAATGWHSTRAAAAPLAQAARIGAAEALRGIEKSRETLRQADLTPYRTEMVKSMKTMKRAAKAGAKAARDEVRRPRRRRMPILLGVLAAGAVVGTVGAVLARRRSRALWEDYDQQAYQAAAGDRTGPADEPIGTRPVPDPTGATPVDVTGESDPASRNGRG